MGEENHLPSRTRLCIIAASPMALKDVAMTPTHNDTLTAVTETTEAMRTRASVSFVISLGSGPTAALARSCER